MHFKNYILFVFYSKELQNVVASQGEYTDEIRVVVKDGQSVRTAIYMPLFTEYLSTPYTFIIYLSFEIKRVSILIHVMMYSSSTMHVHKCI